MGLNSKNTDTHIVVKKNIANCPSVEVRRVIKASVKNVWAAWSEADLINQWWRPEGYTSTDTQTDFRRGGKYLFSMKDKNGKIGWSAGQYEDIVPLKKIVCTSHFSDKNGKMISAQQADMPGEWPPVSNITIEFEALDGSAVKMNLCHEGILAEMHDDCVEGWSSSSSKLQRLVEKN